MTTKSMTGIDFDKLWADPKYIALHDRKSKRWAEYVAAYVPSSAAAVLVARMKAAEAAHTRALKRIYAYEAKHGT
jgi:hypothetical protein